MHRPNSIISTEKYMNFTKLRQLLMPSYNVRNKVRAIKNILTCTSISIYSTTFLHIEQVYNLVIQ